jgi:hypothetical protein
MVYDHLYMPMSYGRAPVEDYRARWAVGSLGLERNVAIAVVGAEHAQPGASVEVVHPLGTELTEVVALPCHPQP